MENNEQHESFSDRLREIRTQLSAEGISLGDLQREIGQQSTLLLISLLTVPFLLPVSIPGTSFPFGLAILILGAQSASGRVYLPKKLKKFRLNQSKADFFLDKAATFFEKIEKFIHPRRKLAKRVFLVPKTLLAVLISFSGVLLMAPFPLPFTNAFPAYAALILSLGLLEEDAAVSLIGIVMFLIAAAYIFAICVAVLVGFNLIV